MTRTRAAAADEGSHVGRATAGRGNFVWHGESKLNRILVTSHEKERGSLKVHSVLLTLSAAEQTPGCRKHPLLAVATAFLTHDCMMFLENAADRGGAKKSRKKKSLNSLIGPNAVRLILLTGASLVQNKCLFFVCGGK